MYEALPQEIIRYLRRERERAEKEEADKKRAAADREARKKSRDLLDRVKDAWPKLSARDQQSFTDGVEGAARTASSSLLGKEVVASS